MDYYHTNILNQAIYDAEREEEFNNELERLWDLKLREAWKLIRRYQNYINYSEIQTNNWISQQIELDTRWQINWKAQWKTHNSQPNVIQNNVWESEWILSMYTRHVYRNVNLTN